MKRLTRSILIAALLIIGVLAGGRSTIARASTSSTSTVGFPLRNSYGYGIYGQWEWNTVYNTSTVDWVDPAILNFPGYALTSAPSPGASVNGFGSYWTGYDAGGNSYSTMWGDWQAKDNKGNTFTCFPRILVYSYGGSYFYWGQSPDTRCTDFSSDNNGTGGTCGSNPTSWTPNPINPQVYDSSGTLVGTWHVNERVLYSPAGPYCAMQAYSAWSFSCSTFYRCESQLDGTMTGAGGTVGNYAGSTQTTPPFVEQDGCNSTGYGNYWCQSGIQHEYVYVKKIATGVVSAYYAESQWGYQPWTGAYFAVTTSASPICCSPVLGPPKLVLRPRPVLHN